MKQTKTKIQFLSVVAILTAILIWSAVSDLSFTTWFLEVAPVIFGVSEEPPRPLLN